MAWVVEDDDDWDLRGSSLSKDVDVRACLRVDFAGIQSQCRKLGIQGAEKACTVFGLALQDLKVLQAGDEAEVQIVA